MVCGVMCGVVCGVWCVMWCDVICVRGKCRSWIKRSRLLGRRVDRGVRNARCIRRKEKGDGMGLAYELDRVRLSLVPSEGELGASLGRVLGVGVGIGAEVGIGTDSGFDCGNWT